MAAKKNFKQRNSQSENIQNIYLLPILIALAIVPMIVFMKAESLTGVVKELKGTDNSTDFFNYYKAMWLIGCAIIASAIFLVRMYMRKLELKKSNIYIPLGIYCGFIIISALMSEYKDIAFMGFTDRSEGMLVLLSYLLLCFATFNFVNSEKAIKWIIYSLAGSALIIGGIGCFQYLGHDFFTTSFGRHLILPKAHEDMAETLTFQFGKNRTYTTLFNPNYVASYVVLVLPVLTSILFFVKNIFAKAVSALALIVVLFSLVGSESRAGFGATLITVVLLIFAFRKNVIKHYKIIIIGLASLAVLFVGFNALSGWRITNSIKHTISRTITGLKLEEDKTYIKDISIEKNVMIIMYNSGNLAIANKNGSVSFYDDKGKPLSIKLDKKTYHIQDERYKDVSFSLTKEGAIQLFIGNKMLYVYNLKEGIRIAGITGKPDVIHSIEKVGFKGKEMFFDGRGYIWSRTIPLLKKSFFIGYGPDTYAIEFPQNDYVGKLNSFSTIFQLVDKPHNLYLGIGVSSGVLSLIAFLIAIGIYLIMGIKLYIKGNYSTLKEVTGVCILISVVGYCLVGIFNDSTVTVAPVFWILFGLGMACNFMVRREREQTK